MGGKRSTFIPPLAELSGGKYREGKKRPRNPILVVLKDAPKKGTGVLEGKRHSGHKEIEDSIHQNNDPFKSSPDCGRWPNVDWEEGFHRVAKAKRERRSRSEKKTGIPD